ncbi:hypothetical protein Y032_0102g3477 [Ancylostoma ceylanicum]|uniref:Uncharacterized protein n=1 Tax=Ancylostoma ceylanicum TaxID=53326 RepID=A0A016THN2_9BILA|nr:hypothetical protein Y032_0102g3477 [Ancylostoma ceylanicum]
MSCVFSCLLPMSSAIWWTVRRYIEEQGNSLRIPSPSSFPSIDIGHQHLFQKLMSKSARTAMARKATRT